VAHESRTQEKQSADSPVFSHMRNRPRAAPRSAVTFALRDESGAAVQAFQPGYTYTLAARALSALWLRCV
jgi:hypothetical protein